jgi:hypothetical protein
VGWPGMGVVNSTISDGPSSFGSPMGKTAESSLIFGGPITFGGFFLQFSVAVNGPVKIGYSFSVPHKPSKIT